MGESTAQSLHHGEGCQSGGSTQQTACKPVPALAESGFQTKKEDAHFEWAFKQLEDLRCVIVFAAGPAMPGYQIL